MQSSCNTEQTTVGLPLSDHIVSEVICQHPSLSTRTVHGLNVLYFDEIYIGKNDVKESMVTIRSPFCVYNLA